MSPALADEETTTPPRRTVRGRVRDLDLLMPLTGLVALAVYLTNGFQGEISRDVGIYSYGGQQFADGVAPYVAILNRNGPLAHLVPGIGAWVAEQVGVDELLGMRVLFALISAAAVAASYVLSRDLFRSRVAGIAGAAALLSLQDFAYYATSGPREKTTMVLLVTLALVALARRRWATAGLLVSLATLTWQPVLFGAAPAAAVAALLQPHGRLRALVRFAVGGLAPLAGTLAAYALIHRVNVFWDCFFLINLRYTNQGSVVANQPTRFEHMMMNGYGWSAFVLAAGLLLQLVWSVRAANGPDRHEALPAAQVGLGLFALANAAWCVRAFNGTPDAFVLFPSVVVGVAGLVALLAERLDRRAVVAVAAAWATAVVALGFQHAVASRDTTLVEQRRDVQAVVAALPPGAQIMSVDAPGALVLADKRNPSRVQNLGHGLRAYLVDTYPGGLAGYRARVADLSPAAFAIGKPPAPGWVRPLLRRSYARVGSSPGWAWFVRRDLGRATIHGLRDVLA